jgi:hypothetical protein
LALKRIGEILLGQGKLDQLDLARALRLQDEGERRERIGAILIANDWVSEQDLYSALATQLSIPLAQPSDYPEIPILEEGVSVRFLRENRALPLRETDDRVVLAMVDPLDDYVRHAIQLVTGGREVSAMLALPSHMEAALERLYDSDRNAMGQIVSDISPQGQAEEGGDVQHLKDLASEAPVIRLVSLLIERAIDSRASDIHIEPFENRLIIRYRVDGVMQEVESPPRRLSRGGDLAHQDHGQSGYRRTAPAAGWTHQAAHPRQGNRHARIHRADACMARAWSCACSTRAACPWTSPSWGLNRKYPEDIPGYPDAAPRHRPGHRTRPVAARPPPFTRR